MTASRYLSDVHLARVRGFWKHYLWAATKVGLEAGWALAVAGVHWRESGFRPDAPGEPGGPFCLDPEGEGGQLQRIRDYAASVCAKYGHEAKDPSLEADFPTAALIAAHELRSRAKRPIGSDLAAFALALGRYNGFPRYYCERWQTGQGSEEPAVAWHPYVSNDPLGGKQLYRMGSMLRQDGTTVRLERAPDSNAGAAVIILELKDRWHEWFKTGDEVGGGPCA